MTQQLTIDSFWNLAAVVSGVDQKTIAKVSNSHIIDSALNAPFTGFGGYDLYPEMHQKVGVLGYRLIKAHGLPDRNKRTAIAAMKYFAHINCCTLSFADEAALFQAVVDAAASVITEDEFVEFIATCLVG